MPNQLFLVKIFLFLLVYLALGVLKGDMQEALRIPLYAKESRRVLVSATDECQHGFVHGRARLCSTKWLGTRPDDTTTLLTLARTAWANHILHSATVGT